MRNGHIFLSAIHLVLCVALILVGAVLFHTFFNPALTLNAFAWLMQRTDLLWMSGLGLIGFGVLLVLSLFFIHKHKYYELCVDLNNKYVVDPKVLEAYTRQFWKKEVDEKVPYDIYIDRKGNLCIIASLNNLQEEEELVALEKIQSQLAPLLFEKTGFNKSIRLKALKA